MSTKRQINISRTYASSIQRIILRSVSFSRMLTKFHSYQGEFGLITLRLMVLWQKSCRYQSKNKSSPQGFVSKP
jgi:hypothetical protein